MATPSLAMIPSAIADSKVYSVLPNNGDGDFTFNRDSSATRVGQNGLIQTVGFFGSELVTNGDFATDSDWTKGTGWTISGGKANSDGSQTSQSNLFQTGIVPINKTYKATFTIVVTSGSMVLSIGGSNAQPTVSSSGTYSFTSKATSGDSNFYFSANSSFVGSVDNVSVKEVLGDQPRLNYDISNGVVQSCPSLLLEPASTNLINYSQAISNTPVKNGTFVDNAAISPDGTLNATKLTATTTDPFFYQSITFAAATYTSSIYVKGIGDSIGKEFRIAISSFTTAPKLIVPSEWTRFEFTATVGAGTGTSGIEITDPAIVGDKVLVWGWQVEQQSYPTSYIPTLTGSAVTRASETLNNAGNSDLFNDSEGVLYAEIAALSDDLTFRTITLSDGTTSNNVGFGYRNNSNVIYTFLQGVINSSSVVTVSNITDFNKVAIKYKSGNFAMWVNGVEVYTNAGTFTLNGLSEVSFDNGGGAADFYGKCKTVAVFKEALSDTELACLTSTNNREIFLNYYYRMQYVGANTEAIDCAQIKLNV